VGAGAARDSPQGEVRIGADSYQLRIRISAGFVSGHRFSDAVDAEKNGAFRRCSAPDKRSATCPGKTA